MRLSIIIPVLNESEQLPALLQQLSELDAELVVADGGSTDDSVTVAHHYGARVIAAPRGRARQMNAGACAASGQALLFLHADTRLPAQADELISQALEQTGHAWGRFDVEIDGCARMLPLIAAMMNMRSRLTGIATGDQALFMSRGIFERIGGFRDQPLMEDIEICRCLKRESPPRCLRQRVKTSGRRWEEHGVLRTVLLMWSLRLGYWFGVSPATLARHYR